MNSVPHQKPKRFYKCAEATECDGEFRLALDGRLVRTPARKFLQVPSARLAAALAEEWNEQGGHIDYDAMPLTRLSNAVIDRVAARMEEVRQEAAGFIDTDVTCFWAEEPASLAQSQSAAFSPLLAWAEETLGASLEVRHALVAPPQSGSARASLMSTLEGLDPFALFLVVALAGSTGSLVLALAAVHGRIGFVQAYELSRIEEIWQNERWGVDAEGQARSDRVAGEVEELARFFSLVHDC